MAEITFDGLNENSLIMQWNTDNYGNPKSIHINNEIQQVSPTHNVIQLAQVPDEYYRVKFVAEGINGWLLEVRNLRELKNINNFYVDYNHGIVYFHEEMAGRLVRADYYGRGVMFLSDARIFHKSGDSFATTLDEVLEKSQDALKLLESTGGLNEAIELLDQKAEEGTQVADRLEDFISETEFYGYTIVLSREAFVVKAKEDGNLHNGELEDLTTDVVVYKGAKSLSAPDLDVRIYSTTNCECEIDKQTVRITKIDTNAIKGQVIVEIDCGDGLIAYRTIEVTKVFDGVSQFNVEVTNSFYSFNATHSGKVEEEQSVTCEFNVTRANELYKDYVVGVQNIPTGMICNLTKPTEGATSVTFTVPTGKALPDNGSVSLVFQMNEDTVITKTFVFSKTKQGLSAKSLMLAGNQIIHYENPNYEGTPTPLRTSITAQVTDLSGTPVWSYLEGEEWIVIDGQNGTNLILYHNDRIWGDKHELTIKCELDGFTDEITLIKIANGATGLSSYSVILTNESTTLRVGLDGTIATEELLSQYTRVTAFKGSEQITPTSISVPESDSYKVQVSGSTISLLDVDTSRTTVNIPIDIILDNAVIINKVWSISKTEPGEHGAAGAVYSINIEGGTRAITYNQLNENPRPTFSGLFTATIYENGNDITSKVSSWYWVSQGHLTGTSITSSFTPEIKETFDESILTNSVTVTAIYKHTPISYTVPIVISKDVSGLDWVTDWDSTKVSVKNTEILTPKLFAGTYNEITDSVTGVAMGTDVLNDGQVAGITAWQNNEVTFLLGTDGSLMVGNPFDTDGSGLSYSKGKFVLNVDDMSIAGVTVPSWDDMEEEMDKQAHLIINTIQANIDSMNSTLDEVTNYVDSILQDEVVTELEKVQLDSLFEVVQQEVLGVQAQYESVINNPYLPDEEVTNLQQCYANYIDAYNNIVDVYNDVFGEGTVEEIPYTTPEEEYLEAEDFAFEEVNVVNVDEVLGEEPETPVTYADTTDVNPVSLDTLVTRDGYVLVTLNGEVITMVTENTLLDFEDAVAVLREYSAILQQAISEALLSISENRATMLVEQAKEEVKREIADVDSALNDLETTMNGSFKSGLIGEQSKAILNERLMQLDIEKKDVDGQYEVLSQNSALDTLSKEKLSLAKTDLDAAHDVLVAKINQVIIDNLMTDSELQAVNDLISEYANELQNYSKVAQECNATIAINTANLAVEAITDEDVFNKVTNYGVTQGLFIKDEKVYINSEYINTRNFKAVTDEGTQTFLIDENGEVSITAKSLAITGSSNLATQDYVNTQIENLTNTNITFTLSNEFQIIPTDESYYPLSEGTYSIKIMGYQGSSQEITDFTIGTVSSSDAGIIAVTSNINKTVVLTVSPDTPLADSNGYVDIPITYNDRQFNKRWSWAVSKQGNQATYVTISGEQFFKYSNNYTGTPSPSTITLTANVYNSTETGKWQYDNNGTWVDCGVTSKTLSLSPTQYTLPTLKRILVRYYVDSVFDTYTVACISDGSNGTNGKGISTIVNKYLATNLSSGVTTSTSGWTSVVQEISASKKYLWNYEIITYTDNTTTETTPCIIGTYGEDGETGVGISKITEYYLTSSSTNVSDVLLGDWSTSMKVPNKDAKYLWNYSEITYTDGIMSAQSPRIIGNFAEDGASGSDAYTVLLTNENHTFVANHLGATTEQIVYSDVIAYKGTTPITPTIGTLPTVTGLTLAKSGVRITIKSNTGTSLEDSGSFNIPITVDGQTFTKSFSWTKVKDGQDGETGASAKSVNIVASNMVFKSTDGGVTFTPNTIKLTAQYQNLTHSRWQYSTDGGTTWINVYDGNNGGWQGGITGTSDSLTITIPKTCTFFTDTTTSVVFKTISTDESFYDVITITKLYDVADVDFEGIAEDIANEKVNALDNRLNQQAVFDRLTNNGTSQGMYLENGQLYINGEYIEANTIKVDQLEVGSITMFVEDKVQDSIDNIEIGGRNLIPNSNFGNKENPYKYWRASDSKYFTYIEEGGYILYDHSNQSGTYYQMPSDAIPLDDGTTQVTFSFYVKVVDKSILAEDSVMAYIRFYDNSSETSQSNALSYYNISLDVENYVNDTWVRITQTIDVPTTLFCYARVSPFVAKNGKIYWKNFQLEAGNKVTNWSPAPQDEIDNLSQEQIFNKLTNNGQSQGIFLDDGELYVNGEFINSKNLSSVDNSGNQTFLIDENGNVHINANTFTLGGKGVTTTQDVLDLIDEYGQADNLLLTPNFNSGSLTNWSWSVGSYVFVNTDYKHDGNTACKLQYTGTSNAISLATSHMSIDKIQGGSTYKASMYIYCEGLSANSGTYYLRINGTPVGSTTSAIVADRTFTSANLVAGQWVEISFEFTPTQDYTSPRLLITGTGAINAWVTDFSLQKQGQGLNQEQIVQILNGAGQGFYIVDGQALINAEYIKTGTLAADLIKVRVDETSNLLPFNYVTMDNAINNNDFYISEFSNGYPYAEIELPIYSSGGDVDCLLVPFGYSNITVEKGKSYWFSCEVLAQWGNDTKLDNGTGGTSTATGGSKYGLATGDNLNIVLYSGNTATNMASNGYVELASINDFNSSINVEEREDYDGVYSRVWTRLVGRLDSKVTYTGKLWIHLDCSGFQPGDYGYFYIKNLQLTDASLNNENIQLDYIQQLKEKRIELTDGSYYANLVGVDGIKLTEGDITGKSNSSTRGFTIDYDGFEVGATIGTQKAWLGYGKAQYMYDGGSSGWIDGYDNIFGVSMLQPVDGDREGIFIGINEGMQNKNGAYGRADIYKYTYLSESSGVDDFYDLELLGQKIEPLGLVRRDDYSNITAQTCLCIAGATGTGGTTYNGATVFSEAMYNTVGNGQLINVHPSMNRIYFGNPSSNLILESSSGITVNEAGVERQIVTNGTQHGNVQLNLYTGSNIEIWADSDCSTTTERIWIGAGKNAITITSNGQNTSNTGLKYNGQEIIHGGNRDATGMVYGTCLSGSTNVSNLNNIWRSGFYDGQKLSNAPENNTGWFWVINASHMSNSTGYRYGLQIAGLNIQGNAVWMRCTNDQGEGTWYRYYNTGYQQTSTSDIRYKRAIADVDTSDCYDMVRNTQLHHYLLLDDTDELRACSEDGIEELETELYAEGYSRKIQMGIIAQDVLKYECGKYFVVQDVDRDDDGNIKSDKYSIDAYNYASAILGGLQEEIKVRDEQYEELKKENEDLKARLEKLEKLILKGE